MTSSKGRNAAASLLFWLAAFGEGCDRGEGATGKSAGAHTLRIRDSTELRGEFGAIVGAVRTSTGAVVVADRGQAALHVLRPRNDTALKLGRDGDGPGEFRLLYRVHLCNGDTVIAYDFSQSRLHLFTETGFVRQIQLPPRLVGADFVGCTGPDTLVFSKIPDKIPGMGLQLEPITLFRYSPKLGATDWLATLRGTEMYISERYQAFYARPFGINTLVAAGPRGVAYAESGRFELQQLLGDGRSQSIFFRPHKQQKVNSADRTHYLRESVAAEPDSGARVRLCGVLAEAQWGTYFPAVDRVVASQSGQFWIRRPPRADQPNAEWTIVARGSSTVDTVVLPRELRVLFIDGYEVLGVAETAGGDEKLIVYSLARVATDRSR